MVLQAIKDGIIKALRTALMLLRIMIPIFIGVTFLKHTGFFQWLAVGIEPAMRLFGLPGEAVLPLVVGAFTDEYTTVATMSGFSFDMAQITIISMIVLAFHGLPVETAISRQIGMPALRMALFRVGLAVFTGIVVALLAALFLGGTMPGVAPDTAITGTVLLIDEPIKSTVPVIAGAVPTSSVFNATWDVMLMEALRGILNTVLILLRVLIPLMIGIEILLRYKVIEALADKMRFFCRLLGIGKDALLPLLVGLFLGVTYGAGAIAEMNRLRPLPKRDLALVGVFLFSCHSIIEATYLFAVAGANAFIVSFVRLAIAIGATVGARMIFSRRIVEK